MCKHNVYVVKSETAVNSNMDFTEKVKKGCKFMKGVILYTTVTLEKAWYGPVVKRSRHRPFTAVTRVRFPSGSLHVSV